MNLPRWHALMARLNLPLGEHTCCALIASYAEPQRQYHTARHIEDCLAKLDESRHLAEDAGEVELALWFHDAVYNPLKVGNELASAEWATRFLREAGAEPGRIERVHALIMATQHSVLATTDDVKLLVDIDLSILGADEAGYAEFERNVRREYRWVPYFLYRKKRREILQSFLGRSQIYSLTLFRERFELRARDNLRRAIASL